MLPLCRIIDLRYPLRGYLGFFAEGVLCIVTDPTKQKKQETMNLWLMVFAIIISLFGKCKNGRPPPCNGW
ncbi:hypothetical protein Y032_0007g3174 [Ancylostoma ceylanicum]|uniref:Uncharacterized protein n=1 Tax=Ancylostoma ceylanicum TaxID=53326 RepID=A0A016VLN7_9BILA|nr:hypothetical protein Y032_0007g3174 [Ancylostoma ceylanicum]